MPGKRYKFIQASIGILFIWLLLRLFYLQVCDGKKLSREASSQRMANLEIEKVRGNIFDKNSIPFTNRSKRIFIALKPLFLRGKEDEVASICDILSLDFSKIKREIEIKREPVLIETDEETKEKIAALHIEGISYIHTLKRYDNNSAARHLTGYLNQADQIGQSGIEKSYEKVLDLNKEGSLGVVTDARYNLLKGLGYRMIEPVGKNKVLNVKLTLDYHIQKIAEAALTQSNLNGAVVVEDISNGDILAMVSKPDFDPNHVADFLSSPDNALFNRAVASYNLGSIFKIVDAALIYERNFYFDDDYLCSGSILVGDKEYKCSSYDKGGHGWMNISDAFAVSCNSFFIHAGINLGYKNITAMAKKFGLGSITGIKDQGIDEAPGMLPQTDKYFSDGDTANISIGQGEIMATPLQVTDLIATVANGGIKNRVNVVDSIVDNDGNVIKDLRMKEQKRIISKNTSDRVRRLMEEVTERGTGTKAALEEYGGAGGKTGTAETGQVIDGRKITHAWFAGYFPKNNPRYAMTVFIEDGNNGGQIAAPIFTEIAQGMIKAGY